MSWMRDRDDEGAGRTRRTMAAAAAVLLAGAAVAGCSDDDDGATTTAQTESTTETEEGGASAQEQVTVDIVSIDEAFQPSSATVTAGGDVSWVNADDVAHTTTADEGAWDSGTLEPGAEFTFSPDEPGTYSYGCSIHPSMTAELIVE